MRLPPPYSPFWDRYVLALAIAILLLILVAAHDAGAASVDAYTFCDGNARPAGATISIEPGELQCFEYDVDHGTAATGVFFIQYPAVASVCLNPDRNSAGGGTVVELDRCDEVPSGGANADNLCNHTGLTLSASNACEALTWGPYRFDMTTAAGAGEDARLTIRGY